MEEQDYDDEFERITKQAAELNRAWTVIGCAVALTVLYFFLYLIFR